MLVVMVMFVSIASVTSLLSLSARLVKDWRWSISSSRTKVSLIGFVIFRPASAIFLLYLFFFRDWSRNLVVRFFSQLVNDDGCLAVCHWTGNWRKQCFLAHVCQTVRINRNDACNFSADIFIDFSTCIDFFSTGWNAIVSLTACSISKETNSEFGIKWN